MGKNIFKKDTGAVENVPVQNIKELSKEQLRKNIEILTAKRDEIHSKLVLAKLENKDSTFYNSLMTIYASVCGSIVDFRTALMTFSLFAVGTIIHHLRGEADILDYAGQEVDTTYEMILTDSELGKRYGKKNDTGNRDR